MFIQEQVIIKRLNKQDTEYINAIAGWLYNWWGKTEGYEYDAIRDYASLAVCEERIPQTFIALKGTVPVGMYHIMMSDCKVRPDVYPWLTDVFVAPDWRGHGIGQLLIESVYDNAKTLGLKEIFLYTHLDDMYEKFGWKFIEYFNPYTSPKGVQKLYRLEIK